MFLIKKQTKESTYMLTKNHRDIVGYTYIGLWDAYEEVCLWWLAFNQVTIGGLKLSLT